jgi:RND family efflux transporter MFP subunit
MFKTTAPLALAVAIVVSAGCRPPKPPPKAPPPPKVTVAKPTRQDVINYREYTGYLEPVKTANVRARVRGFLQSIHFEEGAEVKKGDLLYELDPREFQAALNRAQADLAKADAELRKAKADVERVARIRGTSVSAEDYLQRVASKETAEAAVKQATAAVEMAELDVSFTHVTSPIDGKVSRTLVTEGNLVGFNEATLLTTVVTIDPIHVYFDVPEQYAVAWDRAAREKRKSASSAAVLPLEVGVCAESGFPHKGEIDFRENRVDTGTGTIRIRGLLPNPDRALYPGLYTRVRVPEGEAQSRLMVPEVAVMSDQRGRFVYVVKADNTVEYRAVTLGGRVGPLVAVEKGLEPDDRVIVNGIQRARANMTVDPQDEKQGSEARGQGSEKSAKTP